MSKQLNFFEAFEFEDIHDYKKRATIVSQEKCNQLEAMLEDVFSDDGENKQLYAILKAVYEIKNNNFIARDISIGDFIDIVKKFKAYDEWSNEAKTIFDLSCDILTKWKDFFFSYSNKERKFIDSKFDKIIAEFIDKFDNAEPIKKDTTLKIGYIVHYHLKNENLNSFHDMKNIKNGQDISNVVKEGCKNAFSFVQLVHQYSFTHPEEGEINWCFEEYSEYKNCKILANVTGLDVESIKNFHFLSLQSGLEKLIPANIKGYEKWWADIKRLKYTSIDKVNTTEELISIIKDNEIPEKIMKIRNTYIHEILKFKKKIPTFKD